MRCHKVLLSILSAVTLSLGLLVLAPTAGATASPGTGGEAIATLALANVGKHACSRNSLGGTAYGSSCTGNGGEPEYWCADFAKWVWAKSGVFDVGELTAEAGSFYSYGLANDTLTAIPAVGDVAVFNYAGGGVAEHVAVVTAVEANGEIETVSGDWGGESGSEAHFSSTSTVTLNAPAYLGAVGSVPDEMGMTLSGFVAPLGITVEPVVGASVAPVGTVLTAGKSLAAPDGLWSLTLNPEGLLEELAGGRVLWSAGVAGEAGDSLVLTPSGTLELESTSGSVLWSTDTAVTASGPQPATIGLSIADNGRIALDGPTGVLWSISPAGNVLSSATTLKAGEKLIVAGGLYQLDMQQDGNLVEYTAGRPLWWTGTKSAGARAVMRPGGNLIVESVSNTALWSSHTAPNPGAALELLPTGKLVVATATAAVWSNDV